MCKTRRWVINNFIYNSPMQRYKENRSEGDNIQQIKSSMRICGRCSPNHKNKAKVNTNV
jgi:hypothetical protein